MSCKEIHFLCCSVICILLYIKMCSPKSVPKSSQREFLEGSVPKQVSRSECLEASVSKRVLKASSQSKFSKRVLKASSQSEFSKRVLKTSSQSEFSKRVLEASSQSKFSKSILEAILKASSRSLSILMCCCSSTQEDSLPSACLRGLVRHLKKEPTETVALCFGYPKTPCLRADGKLSSRADEPAIALVQEK
jgi:hypothetical protein